MVNVFNAVHLAMNLSESISRESFAEYHLAFGTLSLNSLRLSSPVRNPEYKPSRAIVITPPAATLPVL